MPPPRKRPSASRKRPAAASCSDPPHKKPAAATLEADIKLPPLPESVPDTEFLDRMDALNKIAAYVRNVQGNVKGDSNKFEMMGCSGMKGIGKTAVLVKAAETIPQQYPAVKATYVTFNGGHGLANSFQRNLKPSRSLADTFGCAVMEMCGLDTAGGSFDQCINLLRSKLGCECGDTLLICVDEIGQLDLKHTVQMWTGPLSMSTATASSLMGEADDRCGKLAFIFSHIQQNVLEEGESGSGRIVNAFLLPALSLHQWKRLLPTEWVEAARSKPAIHHLILSCCGHPRSLVDGLPAALKNQPTLLAQHVDPPDDFLTQARSAIMHTCKFHHDRNQLQEVDVANWFSPIVPVDTKTLVADGQALAMDTNVTVRQPMVLQSWAQRNSGWSPLADHLNMAYAADAGLGPGKEKTMEQVCLHYEAVLRISLKENDVWLKSLYHGGNLSPDLERVVVRAILPPGCRGIVQHVEDFNTEKAATLDMLRRGCIVVSKNPTEHGIEYLSPYVRSDGQLLVAGVQCKFVNKSVNWSEVLGKWRVATKRLDFNDVSFFPLVYSTADQKNLCKTTHESGVFFHESGLFTFTHKMGILRLHVMKLGSVLKEQHPFLDGAKANEAETEEE